MTILPIQSVDLTDQPQVGIEICKLAALKRAGMPVLSGWVVIPTPPAWLIDDRRSFEQKAKLLKKEWMKTPLPIELVDVLKQHKRLLFRETILSAGEVWDTLLEHWFAQLQSIIHRHDGLPQKINLTSELLWQAQTDGHLVQAVFDPTYKEVRIETKIKISPTMMQQIDRLVLQADKKLLISEQYSFWLTKDNLYLIEIRPSTEIINPKTVADPLFNIETAAKHSRSAMKVILNLEDQAYLTHTVDGVMVGLEDLEQLLIIAQAMGDKPVFCSMTANSNPDLEGSLGLVHHKLILAKNCHNFLVALQKEQYSNLNLVLPITKSALITAQLKKQSSLLGIDRSIGVKIWQTLSLPENLWQIDKYIEIGFDGVILNLDRLYNQLTSINDLESAYYPIDWVLLTEILSPALKKLHQAKVTILVSGKLALFAEVLEFLIDSGVWGVVVPKIEADGLTEHLYWAEKKMIKKRIEQRIPL